MPGIETTVLDQLKRVCSELHTALQDVQVDAAAVQLAAQQLNVEEIKEMCKPNMFPIRFDDVKAEVNFLALYHLLDFGSGYDALLQQRMQRGAHEMIQFGVLGMALSDQRLEGPWLRAFNTYSVHNYFGLEIMEDQPLPNLPGVTISKPGPLAPLAQLLQRAVAETGHALESVSQRSLGGHILALLDERIASGRSASAGVLVEELAKTYPAFHDVAEYQASEVPFHRKAQNLVADLHLRFGQEDPRFNFYDIDQLTADTGCVVPAMLRSMGVLQYSAPLAERIDAGTELEQGDDELAIRVSTISAVDALVKAAGGGVSPMQLSAYLRIRAESTEGLHMHRTRGTLAY